MSSNTGERLESLAENTIDFERNSQKSQKKKE